MQGLHLDPGAIAGLHFDFDLNLCGLGRRGRGMGHEGVVFVLDNFGKGETARVKELLPVLTEALELWLKEGITPVMNKYSGKAAE